jgi:hypothetical protein
MATPRLDPATPGSPVLGAVVTPATLTRVLKIAAARGVSKSVVTRELLEYGLAYLDAGGAAAVASRRYSPLIPFSTGNHNGKTRPVTARIPLDQIPRITRLASAAGLTPSEFVRRAVASAVDAAELASAG